MKEIRIVLIIAMTLLVSCATKRETVTPLVDVSQARNNTERYILTYYPVAVEQMELHKIPASITLAQAILEGGAGRSGLVENGNNHFGVKADSRWTGRTVRAFDDGEWCHFRAYDSDMESFEDHSQFLLVNRRYSSLFDLSPTDYKGWARGLKRAGYATDPNYANKLIALIERYNLQQYDTYRMSDIRRSSTTVERQSNSGAREILKANGLLYTIAREGDTFESLARDCGVSKRNIRNYNDLYKNYVIKAGDIIYLEKKNKKATRGFEFHTVAAGESLYGISQKYGIRLKYMYRMNPQYESYTTLKVGDVIRLR